MQQKIAAMKLPAHDRYDYVPITKRPVYDWPEGKRLAVFFCNNIEYLRLRRRARQRLDRRAERRRTSATTPGAITATGSGIWYYLDLLDEFGLPGAHNVNSAVLEDCPDDRRAAERRAATNMSGTAAPIPSARTCCGKRTRRG